MQSAREKARCVRLLASRFGLVHDGNGCRESFGLAVQPAVQSWLPMAPTNVAEASKNPPAGGVAAPVRAGEPALGLNFGAPRSRGASSIGSVCRFEWAGSSTSAATSKPAWSLLPRAAASPLAISWKIEFFTNRWPCSIWVLVAASLTWMPRSQKWAMTALKMWPAVLRRNIAMLCFLPAVPGSALEPANVWGVEAEVEPRSVDAVVKRLRAKLGEAGLYIETVFGVGYRFSDSP